MSEWLNADLEEVSHWSNENRTTFNSCKSLYIAFINRASFTGSLIQSIYSTLPCWSSIDALRVIVAKNLSWSEQIPNIYRTAS